MIISIRKDDSMEQKMIEAISSLKQTLCTTTTLNNNLKHSISIKEFLNNNKKHMFSQTLSEHLMSLLKQKNLRRSDVVRDSLLNKAYVYQIFSGERTPSRDKLLAIAFGLKLTEIETQRLLKLAGYSELYPRIERDAIILYSIQNKQSIDYTNDLLDYYRFDLLGVPKE